jgi:HipA-like protein
MLHAVEHIRRMRGGAQAHLMRCDDNSYYVVKFQNNPQHTRVLANEVLGTVLAGRLGLPTLPFAVIEVRQELIRLTEELVMQVGLSRTPCKAGLQFGSRYPGDPAETAVFDYLPDETLVEIENHEDFLGMLVFDKWTCNTNGRQTLFFREPGRSQYQTTMIDQGFCFNAGEWNFPDAPLRGLYSRGRVYSSVSAMSSFDRWITRLEKQISTDDLDVAGKQIPPEWYGFDMDALYALLERLERRRPQVRAQIEQARDSSRQPFPNWR